MAEEFNDEDILTMVSDIIGECCHMNGKFADWQDELKIFFHKKEVYALVDGNFVRNLQDFEVGALRIVFADAGYKVIEFSGEFQDLAPLDKKIFGAKI